MDAPHVYVRAWALGCFHSLISTRTFRRALTASLDSCAEIKSAPSVAELNLAEFGGRCRKAMLGVCLEPRISIVFGPSVQNTVFGPSTQNIVSGPATQYKYRLWSFQGAYYLWSLHPE